MFYIRIKRIQFFKYFIKYNNFIFNATNAEEKMQHLLYIGLELLRREEGRVTKRKDGLVTAFVS